MGEGGQEVLEACSPLARPAPGALEAVLYLSKACLSTKCIYKSLRMFFFILKLTIIFYCEKCSLSALYCFKNEEKEKKRKTDGVSAVGLL